MIVKGNSWEEIEEKVNLALDIFYVKDKYLIDNDIHERSMTHKLAIYLEGLFKEYDVDCEYNKNISKSKKIHDIEYKIQEIRKIEKDEYKDSVVVFPDITIHKRGNKLKNLLVIEVKKDNAIKNNKSKLEEIDIFKLKAYTTEDLNYRYGIYINLKNSREKVVIKKFENGVEVTEL